MRPSPSALFLLLSSLFACNAASCLGAPAVGPSHLHPADLLSAPGKYLHGPVEVEIVEPLSGPSTPQQLAAAEYGQLRLEMPDAPGVDFSLVPSDFRPEDPNRYRKKFDRVLTSPLRVKGELLSDEELAKDLHRPVYVLRVSAWEPIAPEPAIPVGSLAQLKSDPARWDRKRIVYEGVYENRFEVSALDREIWLGFAGNAEIVGRPQGPAGTPTAYRVRVTGLLFSKPGARYGHLGGYPFELQATKVEFLGPAAPSPEAVK
ncbi:MAG: hypothetical protein U1F66_05865 [bacterium]